MCSCDHSLLGGLFPPLRLSHTPLDSLVRLCLGVRGQANTWHQQVLRDFAGVGLGSLLAGSLPFLVGLHRFPPSGPFCRNRSQGAVRARLYVPDSRYPAYRASLAQVARVYRGRGAPLYSVKARRALAPLLPPHPVPQRLFLRPHVVAYAERYLHPLGDGCARSRPRVHLCVAPRADRNGVAVLLPASDQYHAVVLAQRIEPVRRDACRSPRRRRPARFRSQCGAGAGSSRGLGSWSQAGARCTGCRGGSASS